jgi:excisionase family DNA binding protein
MTVIEQSSVQRVEHAQDDAAYLHSYQGLHSALLGCIEALQKFEEGLNGDERQPPKSQSLRLLSLGEVCQRLGADRASIYQLLIDGEVPCYKLEDDVKIRQADLEEYIQAR